MKILITGSSSGIAYLAGICLYSRGHDVIMSTHTKKECENLKKKIKMMNLDIKVIKLDITSNKDSGSIDFSKIDVLINHASIGVGGSLIDLDIDDIKNNYNVNFFSTLELSKKFLKARINKKEESKLIIMSSIASTIPIEFLGSYCSTKASLSMFYRCLKKEIDCVNKNIYISLIQPGTYKTGFNEFMIKSVDDSINETSIFKPYKKYIMSKLKLKFNITESKDINSIVCQIINCVENNNKKFIYSAPFIQKIAKKLYLILFDV